MNLKEYLEINKISYSVFGKLIEMSKAQVGYYARELNKGFKKEVMEKFYIASNGQIKKSDLYNSLNKDKVNNAK